MDLTARLRLPSKSTTLVAARMIALELGTASRTTLAFVHQDTMTFQIPLKRDCATTAAADMVSVAMAYVSALQDMQALIVQPRPRLPLPRAHTTASTAENAWTLDASATLDTLELLVERFLLILADLTSSATEMVVASMANAGVTLAGRETAATQRFSAPRTAPQMVNASGDNATATSTTLERIAQRRMERPQDQQQECQHAIAFCFHSECFWLVFWVALCGS